MSADTGFTLKAQIRMPRIQLRIEENAMQRVTCSALVYEITYAATQLKIPRKTPATKYAKIRGGLEMKSEQAWQKFSCKLKTLFEGMKYAPGMTMKRVMTVSHKPSAAQNIAGSISEFSKIFSSMIYEIDQKI
jgi:hypothetical protein